MSSSVTEEKNAQNSAQDVRRMVTIEVGQRLQLAREEQGLSLESVSEQIKLSQIQLKALEGGDWQQLPNDTLALAFLRQYARHLGVDIATTVEQLKSDRLTFHQPLTFPDPAIAPNRTWAIASALLLVLLLLDWNLIGSDTPQPADTLPPTPVVPPAQPAASQENDIPATAPAIEPQPSATQENQTKQILPAKSAASPPPTIAQETTEKPTEKIKTSPSLPVHTIPPKRVPDTSVKPAVTKEPSTPKTAAVPHQFSFHANNERVWLLVEIPDGKGGRQRYREVIIRPHHSIEVVRDNPVLYVSVGNAGGVKITYEDKTLYDFGQFGARGMVVRHRKISGSSTTDSVGSNPYETLSR